ncbi:MAG: ABC transporter substrate-binding protein [Firmicutes bacterium]|nr:ABC transporter substrate-binding protein [Bacillota bacterium]
MSWKKVLVLLLALVLVGTLAAACKKKEEPKAGPTPGQQEPKKEEPKKEEPKKEEPKVIDKPLVIGMGADPNSLDPHALNDGNERLITANIFEPLVRQLPTSFELKPLLATKWENVNDTTWRFWLRNDVKFHNGEPFNAESVAGTVKRALNPELNSGYLDLWEGISDAKVVEPFVVDIITKDRNPLVPMRMAWFPMMDPKYVQSVGKDVVEKAVGTGPYKLVKWDRGSGIELARNDAYWGPKPAIGKVTFKFQKEDATRLMALRNGEVHIARDMLPEFKDQMPGFKSISGVEFPVFRINAKHPILKDKRIRQALNYAVDKEALKDQLYSGFARVTQCQQGKVEFPGGNPNLKPYPLDVAKAKQLLADAGYKGQKIEMIGERGRWLKDGELIEAVGAMVKDIGVNVDVKILEFSKWLEVYFDLGNPTDLIFVSNSFDLGDQDRPFSGYIASTGRSSTYLDNIPDLDAKILELRSEMDIQKRNAGYAALWERACDDPPWIYLLNLDDIYGVDPNLNFDPRQDQKILVQEITWKK